MQYVRTLLILAAVVLFLVDAFYRPVPGRGAPYLQSLGLAFFAAAVAPLP